jgi:hypothetical protein
MYIGSEAVEDLVLECGFAVSIPLILKRWFLMPSNAQAEPTAIPRGIEVP